MKTPEQVSTMLVAGTLERSSWPELDDEDFAGEVRQRLAAVGLDLVAANGRWLARATTAEEEEDGFHPTFRLHAVELAMLAALYLHLRYLPRQAGVAEQDNEPSVEVDEILRAFPSYQRTYLENQVLGHLRNAGFVRRDAGRLYSGPYLAAMDEVRADQRAQEMLKNFLLRRYLKRRAEEIEIDATD